MGKEARADVYNGPTPIPGRRPDDRRLVFARTLERHAGSLVATAKALDISHVTACEWYKLLKAGTLLDRFPSKSQ